MTESSYRLITRRSPNNGWFVYRVTDEDTNGILVAEIFDKTLLTVLLHAPAQAIIDNVLSRRDKAHHMPKNDDKMQDFQSAFMKFIRKL